MGKDTRKPLTKSLRGMCTLGGFFILTVGKLYKSKKPIKEE
jgi:hypothetical protein